MEKLLSIPTQDIDNSPTGCCPIFDSTQWDNKLFTMENYNFIKVSNPSILFIPIGMGKVMGDTQKLINESQMGFTDNYLILSKDLSPFKMEHHFYVKGPIEGANNELWSGDFLTMSFEGEYKNIPKWIKLLENKAKEENLVIEEIFTFYTTCPKCAKEYGKNPVILLGRIKK